MCLLGKRCKVQVDVEADGVAICTTCYCKRGQLFLKIFCLVCNISWNYDSLWSWAALQCKLSVL